MLGVRVHNTQHTPHNTRTPELVDTGKECVIICRRCPIVREQGRGEKVPQEGTFFLGRCLQLELLDGGYPAALGGGGDAQQRALYLVQPPNSAQATRPQAIFVY